MAYSMRLREHALRQTSYYIPTLCDKCHEFIFGFGKAGVKCDFCFKNFHKLCGNEISNEKCLNTSKQTPGAEIESRRDDTNKLEGTKEPSSYKNYETKFKKKSTNLIKLGRVSMNLRLQKNSSELFWKGPMIYSTSTNFNICTHYWTLDNKRINCYESFKMAKKLFDVPLDIVKISSAWDLNKSIVSSLAKNPKHLPIYYICTPQNTYFFGFANDPSNVINQTTRNFYNIFKIVQLQYRNGGKSTFKICAPEYQNVDINSMFFINYSEILGSGQFGHVLGGISRKTKRRVAVKIIDKSKIDHNNSETSYFQNEATILFNFRHPGILELIALFDDNEHLYIVTERLSIDLLTMIESTRSQKLTEDTTKFIIYQLLVALASLHDRNVAHCDLKPENVLLVEESNYPHVKICDFGYSKIIGEKSFRRSLVGTPAYSPPEVRDQKIFNKTMDIWSMGVITYVCLCGFFPFNEDDDIYEQIQNADFMFPQELWSDVTQVAKDLIKLEFLQLSLDKRSTARRALKNIWFSEDYELYKNLKELENETKEQWLITRDQEEKWIRARDESFITYL